MPFRTLPDIDRHRAALASVRADTHAGTKAAARGCLPVLATIGGGGVLVSMVSSWDPSWYTEPVTLAAMAAYAAAVWAVWRAGLRWAAPAAAAYDAAVERVAHDVLQPLIADLRPGALYTARAEAPARTLERSRLVKPAPFTSANRIRWHNRGLDLEVFDLRCVVSGDSPGDDRHFIGLLAWAELAGDEGGLYVAVRSRHEFAGAVGGPQDSAALAGFAVDRAYRVVTNWEPFGRAVCTPRLQDQLLALAGDGVWVHTAVADGRVWVAIESDDTSWFAWFPDRAAALVDGLDQAHVARLDRQLAIVEDLASELARGARDYRVEGP